MNRFILALAIFIPLATVFFVTTTSRAKRERENAATAAVAAATEKAETTPKVEKKFCVELTDENFEELVTNSKQPVVLDFWASWCGPCMMLGPHLEEIAKDYEGVALVGKINVDIQKEMAVKFQASNIPLVLVLDKGEVVKRFEGFEAGKTPREIRAVVEGLVNP